MTELFFDENVSLDDFRTTTNNLPVRRSTQSLVFTGYVASNGIFACHIKSQRSYYGLIVELTVLVILRLSQW